MVVSVEKAIERYPKSLPKWFILKAAIICLSFANLSFLNAWMNLLNREVEFFQKYSVTWQQLGAVTLDVLILAVVTWIAVCLAVKSENPVAIRILKWCVFAGLMLPLNILRRTREVSSISTLPLLQGMPVRIVLAVLGAAAGIVLLWKWEKLSSRLTPTLFVILAPMLPLVFASVAWRIYTGPPGGRLPDRPLETALPQRAGAPHVLWFVFDEWDQALSFHRRPPNLELPELDRFRGQSFHSDHAFPPARHTIKSVPSLLTGKTFTKGEPDGASDMLLSYYPNQPPLRLSAQSTVFSEARSAGFNVGIVGFHFPYCRMFGATSCEAHSTLGFLPEEWEFPVSLGRLMVLDAKRQVVAVPFARRMSAIRAFGDEGPKPSMHAITYRQTHEAALRSIVDPRLNLVFIHWNIPHPPGIFDAAKGEVSNALPHTYVENLRLLDRTVRDIRLDLEHAGLWESSTILMTSDHPLRFSSWGYTGAGLPSSGNYQQALEVPFLLKMAGQKQGFTYNPAMQTVVTKDLLLVIMKGEITQPQQVAAWLDHNPPRR